MMSLISSATNFLFSKERIEILQQKMRAKHTAKDEFISMGKRKMETDMSKYANLSAQDLHSGFLNRLYTSRDNEADLLNLMKERYEVNIFLLIFVFSLPCIL